MKLEVFFVSLVLIPSVHAAGCYCHFPYHHWNGNMTITERRSTGTGPFYVNLNCGYFKATIQDQTGKRYLYTDSSNHTVCYETTPKSCALDEQRPYKFPSCVPDDVPVTSKADDCVNEIFQRGLKRNPDFAFYQVKYGPDGTCTPITIRARDPKSPNVMVEYTNIVLSTQARGRRFYVSDLKSFSDFGVENLVQDIRLG